MKTKPQCKPSYHWIGRKEETRTRRLNYRAGLFCVKSVFYDKRVGGGEGAKSDCSSTSCF